VSSPILDVPLTTFISATLLGIIPGNIIHIKTGIMLSDLEQLGGFDITNFIGLFVLGSLSLLPTLFKSKLEEKMD